MASDAHMVSEHQEYWIRPTNISMGSANSWYGLNQWSTILAANPMLITLDATNDVDEHAYKSMEALIRKIWTSNPGTRLIGMVFPKFSDNADASVNSPINPTYMTEIINLYGAYGIPYIDYLTPLQDLVNNQGHHLSEYYDAGDPVHPLQPGHTLIYNLLLPYLPANGATAPASLPARLHDNGDYEYAYTHQVGTINDGTTGTWGTSGTQISSNEVGATVTISGTFASYGLWRVDGLTNAVDVSIDGGAFDTTAVLLGKTGNAVPGGRGSHTIIFRVRSGTVKIDEFWLL